MTFISRRPAAPLDAWIESIWLCRSERRPRALERVLPSGAAQLIVNLAEDETRVYEESASRARLPAIAGVGPHRHQQRVTR